MKKLKNRNRQDLEFRVSIGIGGNAGNF